LLDDAFKLIESLRAELFKSRAEAQKTLGEKEKAESECINAKRKLDQMQARLDRAQEALHAGAQDLRAREVQGAFDQADQEYRVRMATPVFCSEHFSALGLDFIHNIIISCPKVFLLLSFPSRDFNCSY
jgi:hypothetical protein